MVHALPLAPDKLPPATTRLAAATRDDLRVARAYVDRTYDRIAMDRHEHDVRLDSIPLDHLIELSGQIAALEAAAGRVLHDPEPDAVQNVPSTRQRCRDGSP